MKFLSSLFLIFATCVACANPDYVSPHSNVESADAECPLHFPQSQICAQQTWSEAPRNQTYTSFKLTFSDANISAADLKVYLWMPSMGHGSAPVQIVDLGHGQIEIQQVYFVMPGAWEIRFELSKNGQKEEIAQSLMINR